MHPKNLPQSKLNALDLAINEKALARWAEMVSKSGLHGGTFECLKLISLSTIEGLQYQSQSTVQGAGTIAAAIDRLTHAVLPRLERIEALLKPTEAANDPASNKPGAAD